MFQCGPEPDLILAVARLTDGRTVAAFLRDNKTDADLFVTEDNRQPEIWFHLASGTADEMRALTPRLAEFINGAMTRPSYSRC